MAASDSGLMLPWLRRAGDLHCWSARSLWLCSATARAPAGRHGEDHVHACPGRVGVDVGLRNARARLAFRAVVNRHPLADIAAREAAPLGATFTALALITGSLWGKPMGHLSGCGTRGSHPSCCCCFCISVTSPCGMRSRTRCAPRVPPPCSPWSGAVNLPIIVFSVEWWNTLHQGESIFRRGGPHHCAHFPLGRSSSWPLVTRCSSSRCGSSVYGRRS